MSRMQARTAAPVIRAARDGAIVAGLLFAGYLFLVVAPAAGTFGFDAFAYWSLNLAAPYARTAGALGAFTYSPVIARLFAPFGMLPFWQFLLLWDALLVGTVVWLGLGSVRSVLAVFAFPAVASGNVGGLGIAALAGWYGMANPAASVGTRFGATDGDQTTGGILSFGLPSSGNRAVGRSVSKVKPVVAGVQVTVLRKNQTPSSRSAFFTTFG